MKKMLISLGLVGACLQSIAMYTSAIDEERQNEISKACIGKFVNPKDLLEKLQELNDKEIFIRLKELEIELRKRLNGACPLVDIEIAKTVSDFNTLGGGCACFMPYDDNQPADKSNIYMNLDDLPAEIAEKRSALFKPTIKISPNDIYKASDEVIKWTLLHEMGHATKPFNTQVCEYAPMALLWNVGLLWGLHKSKAYKNKVTCILSKCVASFLVGNAAKVGLYHAEERRADNFANKHATLDELRGGVNFFENVVMMQKRIVSTNNKATFGGDYVPYAIGKYIIDPIHPSADSRIAKINKVMKERFGVDA